MGVRNREREGFCKGRTGMEGKGEEGSQCRATSLIGTTWISTAMGTMGISERGEATPHASTRFPWALWPIASSVPLRTCKAEAKEGEEVRRGGDQ